MALDTCWPIETPRCILCKAMAMAIRDNIADLCEVDQFCSGLKGGIKGAVHAMREMFEEHHGDGWGLLLADARNAFNSLNRAAAIWNSPFNGLVVPGFYLIPIMVMPFSCWNIKRRLNLVLVKVILCLC